MRKICYFLLLVFMLFLPRLLFSQEFPLIKLNNIFDIGNRLDTSDKTLVIFSSRYYIDFIRNIKPKDAEVYWVLPVSEITDEDLIGLEMLFRDLGRDAKVYETAEGVIVEYVEGDFFKILPFPELQKIVTDKLDILVDVDFFFRRYLNTIVEINNEKTLEIIKFYRSLEEYELIPDTFYLVLSKDVSLPDWVDQFAYILERVHKNFREKSFPRSLYLLDEVGKFVNFGLYDDAYETLLDIFPEEKENPFFYEKMMIVSSKLLIFDDVLKAFEEGYKKNSQIISLVPEIARELMEKEHFYPAYLLVKSAKEKEIWNKEVNNLLTEVIASGHRFYNRLNEDMELYRFFKEEFNKLKK